MKGIFGRIGRIFFTFLRDLSSLVYLFKETMHQIAMLFKDRKRLRQGRLMNYIDEIGAGSLPLVLTASMLLGTAITVLVSFQLKEFGGLGYVPGLVAASVLREMGPLITALIIAGRVGAAFTARIGTMKVSEEILALETMAINPVRFLVVYRFLGLVVSLPALTVLAEFTALIGGFMFGTLRLGIPADTYLRESLDVITFKDLGSGIVKSIVYATAVSMIGCYRGLVVEGGAEEVGKATMLSVVSASITIIVLDTVMTGAFYG